MRLFSNKGFTLIELIVAMAIIGILGGLIYNNFSSARLKARDVKRKSDLDAVKKALQLYYSDYDRFPAASGGRIQGCGNNGTSNCNWGTDTFGNGTNVYMGRLPQDPTNTGAYVYTYTTSATVDYQLRAQLEVTTDPDAARSQQRCGVSPTVPGLYVVCNQ